MSKSSFGIFYPFRIQKKSSPETTGFSTRPSCTEIQYTPAFGTLDAATRSPCERLMFVEKTFPRFPVFWNARRASTLHVLHRNAQSCPKLPRSGRLAGHFDRSMSTAHRQVASVGCADRSALLRCKHQGSIPFPSSKRTASDEQPKLVRGVPFAERTFSRIPSFQNIRNIRRIHHVPWMQFRELLIPANPAFSPTCRKSLPCAHSITPPLP